MAITDSDCINISGKFNNIGADTPDNQQRDRYSLALLELVVEADSTATDNPAKYALVSQNGAQSIEFSFFIEEDLIRRKSFSKIKGDFDCRSNQIILFKSRSGGAEGVSNFITSEINIYPGKNRELIVMQHRIDHLGWIINVTTDRTFWYRFPVHEKN